MVYVREYDPTDLLCEREVTTTYWVTGDKCTDTGDGDSYVVSSLPDAGFVVQHFADSAACAGPWTQYDIGKEQCGTAGRMRVRVSETTDTAPIVDCRVGWCTYSWPRVPRFPQLPAGAQPRYNDGAYVSDLPPLPPHAACWAVALFVFVLAVLLVDRRCSSKGEMSDK